METFNLIFASRHFRTSQQSHHKFSPQRGVVLAKMINAPKSVTIITSSIVIIAINITNNNNPPPSSSGVVLGRAQMWMDCLTPARVAVSCSSPWINKPPDQKSVSEGIEDKNEKETLVF